jgi:hypothetical protein
MERKYHISSPVIKAPGFRLLAARRDIGVKSDGSKSNERRKKEKNL